MSIDLIYHPLVHARECPLDLKEAISSICFAAPRCADLPELLQVQLAFAGKYGKEFVAAATELRPECGVNRQVIQFIITYDHVQDCKLHFMHHSMLLNTSLHLQLIELLSIRAPAPDVKLKVLKEIAEEHELEWDPSASETELLKTHEDLLVCFTSDLHSSVILMIVTLHVFNFCSMDQHN